MVDPLAGQRGNGPGSDEHAAAAVGEHPEGAARVALIGPGPGENVGQADLGRGDVDPAQTGLVGGEPYGGDLGVGEHDPGNAVVGGGALTAQDVVGDDTALVVGDVGEQRDAGDVPERPQARAGLAVLVDRDGSALAKLDAGALQAEARGIRPAAGAEDDHVGLDPGAVIEGSERAARERLDAGDGAACAASSPILGSSRSISRSARCTMVVWAPMRA